MVEAIEGRVVDRAESFSRAKPTHDVYLKTELMVAMSAQITRAEP